jgi:ElaB/YqjD/DUF883 family membrane-anchored ribosome-binding protein
MCDVRAGIQAVADSAEVIITQSAAAAKDGIAGAANRTQQDITAAEAAAEDTLRNLSSAADGALNTAANAVDSTTRAAATAAGAAAGAVDGAISSASAPPGGSRRNSSSTSQAGNGGTSRGSGSASDSFDSVSVRVPANTAWANNTPARGPIRDVTLTQVGGLVKCCPHLVESLNHLLLLLLLLLLPHCASNVPQTGREHLCCGGLAGGLPSTCWCWSRPTANEDAMNNRKQKLQQPTVQQQQYLTVLAQLIPQAAGHQLDIAYWQQGGSLQVHRAAEGAPAVFCCCAV